MGQHPFDVLMYGAALVVFLLAVMANNRARRLEMQVLRLRAELDFLYAKTGTVFEPLADDRVRALAREGKTIAAIKLYRETTGKGLKESKDAVDLLARGGPGDRP